MAIRAQCHEVLAYQFAVIWPRVVGRPLVDVMHLQWAPAKIRQLLSGDPTPTALVTVVLELLLPQ